MIDLIVYENLKPKKKEHVMLYLSRPFSFELAKSDSEISPKTYIDRLFEDSFNSALKDLSPAFPNVGIQLEASESELKAYVDLPGVKEEHLGIEVSAEGAVSIKATRSVGKSSQEISKSFVVGKQYDLDSMKAELVDGVLCIGVAAKPPPETKLPRKILISSKK